MRQRYIQDPVTFKLVPAEEYIPHSDVNAPLVMPDIQPYRSMITGEIINSRSAHRAHLKQHGCIEIGNETKYLKPKPVEIPKESQRRRKEFLIHLVNKAA